MNKNRKMILDYIKKQKKGTYVAEISRNIDLCITTIARHVRILEKEGHITIRKWGGLNHITLVCECEDPVVRWGICQVCLRGVKNAEG